MLNEDDRWRVADQGKGPWLQCYQNSGCGQPHSVCIAAKIHEFKDLALIVIKTTPSIQQTFRLCIFILHKLHSVNGSSLVINAYAATLCSDVQVLIMLSLAKNV